MQPANGKTVMQPSDAAVASVISARHRYRVLIPDQKGVWLSAWSLIALLLKKVGDEGDGPAKRVGLFSGEGRTGGCGAGALRWAIGVNKWGAVPIHNTTGVRELFDAPGRREALKE
jgi:hypothetical protein